MAELNNANITFTANGESEFVIRDPSFPFTCRLQFIVTTTKKIGRYTPILYIRIVLSSLSPYYSCISKISHLESYFCRKRDT